MPKGKRTSTAKTARASPYSYTPIEATDTADLEPIEGAAAAHRDSGYYSSPENSYQDSPDELAHLTHPRSYGNDHVEKLEVFANDLDQALKNSFPPTPIGHRYPYTGVFVLLLRWMDDDLQVQREITKLHNVFAEQFSFQVEQWQIPSMNPTRALQTKLYDYQNSHQSENELLIVYYGGHSEADPRRGRSLWRANKQPNSPSLNWSSLQHLLETAVPYVLIILDCCFAANAARDTAEGSTKEILAACGRENPTLGVCDRSFTSVLVEEMQAFGKMPFTVAMLHSRLVTMRWRLAFTPIYALLSEHGGSSIIISRIPQISPSLVAELGCSKAPSAELSANGAVELEGADPTADNSLPSPTTRSDNRDTRVLLSVSIAQEAELDVTHWTTWLATAAPWDVLKVDVRIENVFKSHSTIVLVSIPITGWNLLAERPAYRFIGFIRSQNLLQKSIDDRVEGVENSARLERLKSSCKEGEALDTPFVHQPRSTTPEVSDAMIGASQRPQAKLAPHIPDTPQPFDTTNVISKSWAPESDKLLVHTRQQGLNWHSIATQHIPGKTANACRKRHERLMEKRSSIDNWDSDKTESLASAYLDVREHIWKLVADQVGENWQTVEAKCMEEGFETLRVASGTASRHERQKYGSTDIGNHGTTDSHYPPQCGERSSHQDYSFQRSVEKHPVDVYPNSGQVVGSDLKKRFSFFQDSAFGAEEDSAPDSDTE